MIYGVLFISMLALFLSLAAFGLAMVALGSIEDDEDA
jgi:hypothetical protein